MQNCNQFASLVKDEFWGVLVRHTHTQKERGNLHYRVFAFSLSTKAGITAIAKAKPQQGRS